MAIKVGGTTVIDNSRELQNIATVDSTTVSTLNSALNVDPTKGTLTKTFTQNETADITLSSNITSGCPVVSATKEVPQTGVSTKGNWDVNSTASNYDFHNTATNVTLTPSTSLDVVNATYDNNSLSLSIGVQGPRFSSDGTKFFVNNVGSNQIRQFYLNTAWDVSSSSGFNSFSTASQVTDESGFCFSNNGLHLYLTDSNYSSGQNLLHQYSINSSYPYDIYNYGSFTRTVNLTSLGESAPSGGATSSVLVEDSGTKMYIFSGSGSSALIRQYTLSTAYDISSATYANKSFNVYADYGSGGYLGNSSLSSDGKQLLLANGADDIVMHYVLGTAWDISTASRVGTYNPAEDANVSGIHLKPDNSKFFMIGGSNQYIYRYTLGSSPSLALGSGSFASTDVGKRIVGNGGDVILTATSGTYSTTGGSAFTDNSTIAAGSWSMFGLKSAGDADGITMSGIAESYSLNAASYSNISSDYSSGGTDLRELFISPDGTKLFVINTGNNMRRYTLSTPYDITSRGSSYDQTFDLGTTNIGQTCQAFTFSTNGEQFFALAGSNLIRVYFSTAWDLSTGTNQSGDTWSGPSTPLGLDVSSDGYTFYAVDIAGKIFTRTYQSAYNIGNSNGVVSRTFTKGNEGGDNRIEAIRVSSDGLKAFVVVGAGATPTILRYDMTTAHDISTMSYANQSLDISSETYYPTGLAFNSSDQGQNIVMLSRSNASQNSEAVLREYNTGSTTQPTAQYHVAVTNSGGQIDSQYFTDINSMTAAESAGSGTAHYAVSTDGRTTWSVAKGTDGVRPIVRNNSGTWQYNSGENSFGISSASYTSTSLNVNAQESNPSGIFLKPDGTKMYITGYHGDDVNEYNLSTAFDITSATYSQNFSVSSQDNAPQGIFFRPDGLRFWMVGSGSDRVREYYISTAWDISTSTYVRDLSLPSGVQNPTGIFFKSDGTKMYVVADPNKALMYTLSSAWNVASATLSHTHTISENNLPQDIFLKSDGTKVYILGESPDKKVYEYNLSTAYDLSTISYSSNSFNVEPQSPGCKAMTFKPDGSRMYILGTDNDVIYEYNTLSYGTSTTWTNGTVNDELYTLQQALSVESNRMDKTQLDAVADANHFTLGNSLDLMIALRMDTAASTLPTSDGVTLNYDAAALNEGAVLGTDYDFFFPANNKVQIKSLAAQNLKVRVV